MNFGSTVTNYIEPTKHNPGCMSVKEDHVMIMPHTSSQNYYHCFLNEMFESLLTHRFFNFISHGLVWWGRDIQTFINGKTRRYVFLVWERCTVSAVNKAIADKL